MCAYWHNRPFNEVINFGIPGLIFQAEVTKLGVNVGLNILIGFDDYTDLLWWNDINN